MLSLAMVGADHAHLDAALDAVARRSDVRLVAVHEPDPAAAIAVAARTGARRAERAVDVLDGPEEVGGVLVLGRPSRHLAAVGPAAERGLPCFVAAPLGPTAGAAAAVAALLPGASQVGLPLRSWSAARRLRELVGEAGTVRRVSAVLSREPDDPAGWAHEPAEGGGGFHHLALHLVDVVAWLLGEPLEPVGGVVEGQHGAAMLTTRRGVAVDVEAGWEPLDGPELLLEVEVDGEVLSADELGLRATAGLDELHAAPSAGAPVAAWLDALARGRGQLVRPDDVVAATRCVDRLREVTLDADGEEEDLGEVAGGRGDWLA